LEKIKKSHSLISPFFRRKVSAFVFLIPALFLFGLLVWYPIFLGFIMAFQRIDTIGKPGVFVGLQNFKTVFTDPQFLSSLLAAAKFTGMMIICFPIGVFMGIVINEFTGLKKLFRTTFYLPQLFPAVAIYALWTYFFSMNGGFNTVLKALGLSAVPWLQNGTMAFISLQIMTMWFEVGGGILLYSAAIEGINAELYEAADMDGAGWWSKVWHITLPEMKVVLVIILLQGVIGKMQIFDMPYIMTGGGPNNATTTPVMEIYNNAFKFLNLGPASAMSVILFIILIGFSIAYFVYNRKSD